MATAAEQIHAAQFGLQQRFDINETINAWWFNKEAQAFLKDKIEQASPSFFTRQDILEVKNVWKRRFLTYSVEETVSCVVAA